LEKKFASALPKLIRATAVAIAINRSIKTVYKMAAQGRIPSVRFDSGVLFDPDEIQLWIDQHRMAA
jgi:predicted DNA-binding transcriptional regulator AlpA